MHDIGLMAVDRRRRAGLPRQRRRRPRRGAAASPMCSTDFVPVERAAPHDRGRDPRLGPPRRTPQQEQGAHQVPRRQAGHRGVQAALPPRTRHAADVVRREATASRTSRSSKRSRRRARTPRATAASSRRAKATRRGAGQTRSSRVSAGLEHRLRAAADRRHHVATTCTPSPRSPAPTRTAISARP